MPISGCVVDSFSCSVAISISLLMSLPRKSCGAEMRAEVRVVARIPFLIVDAVQYSGHAIRAVAQSALQTHAERRIANFARIGRADRADAVRMLNACFERIDDAARDIALIQHGRSRAQAEIRGARCSA